LHPSGLPPLGDVKRAHGIHKCTHFTLTVGTYPITATYGGDANFDPSRAVLTSDQTVNKADTTTSLVLSPVPPLGSSSLTITVTVTTLAPGAGIPTSVIIVTIDGVTAGTPALSAAGVATLATPLLAPGTHRRCDLWRQYELQHQQCEHRG
jgi:hypothetical protein